MKKTMLISMLALAALACHRKTAPAGSTSGNMNQNNGNAAHTSMVAAGKDVYTANCGKCHGLKPVENYTTDRWTNILKSMIPKAKLNETQSEQVTAYVMANAKK